MQYIVYRQGGEVYARNTAFITADTVIECIFFCYANSEEEALERYYEYDELLWREQLKWAKNGIERRAWLSTM